MSSKTKEQDPSCTISKCINLEQNSPPKLSDRYIVVCPQFFEEELKGLTHFEAISLRDDNLNYENTGLDHWADSEKDYNALAVFSEETYDRLVYVPHQGRLFSCENVIDIAVLINELKAEEAAKVITSPKE